MFYDAGADYIPRRWVEKMKTSMSTLVPVYNTDRMVHQYFIDHYRNAQERFSNLSANDSARARQLSLWKQKIRKNWEAISIKKIESDGVGPFEVGAWQYRW
ncbi:hypothetical protein ES708_32457 [subsurface metagenome]